MNSTLLASGSIDCPCTDLSSVFLTMANCVVGNDATNFVTKVGNDTTSFITNYVTTDAPQLGVSVFTGTGGESTCFPIQYGSNSCQQHDLLVHPSCEGQVEGNNDEYKWCFNSWCYVDWEMCKRSNEIFTDTDVWEFTNVDEIFYSYSTCNSSDIDWNGFVSTEAIKDRTIRVTVPSIFYPAHYKLNISDDNDDADNRFKDGQGDAYFDDNIPWKGYFIDYLNAVFGSSTVGELEYTYSSGGSAVTQSSPWTASVSDVQRKISCLGASQFWMTTERLEMTPFTIPFSVDKIRLFIKNPGFDTKPSFGQNIVKILKPFDPSLWITFASCVIVVAMMQVWFSRKNNEKSKWWYLLHGKAYKEGTIYYRTSTLLRVFFDSILATFIDAFAASVAFDIEGSTSQKVLNFGFGFLVLVTIAGYTANLAAFLTAENADRYAPYISNMQEATSAKAKICGPLALKSSLIAAWPNVEWVWALSSGGESIEADRILNNFDNGICSGIVQSPVDLEESPDLIAKFCERNLVYTSSVVLDVPLALPACEDIIAGISYWIKLAEEQGISLSTFRDGALPSQRCEFSLEFQEDDPDADVDEDLTQLTPENFALPLMLLFFCIIVSSILQLRHHKRNYHPHDHDDLASFVSAEESEVMQDDTDDDIAPKSSEQIRNELVEKLVELQNDQKNVVELLVKQQQTSEYC